MRPQIFNIIFLSILCMNIYGQTKNIEDTSFYRENSSEAISNSVKTQGVYIPNKLTKQQRKNLKKLQGNWTHQQDGLATVNISENKWVFNYSNDMAVNDIYEISFKDTIYDNKKVITVLILSNSSDILEYEMLGLNDTVLSLLYLPRGRLHVYSKTSKTRK